MPIARWGDAQFAARLPTLIWGRGQASEGAHLLGGLKIPPGKKYQIPPDLVVKLQAIDIIGII